MFFVYKGIDKEPSSDLFYDEYDIQGYLDNDRVADVCDDSVDEILAFSQLAGDLCELYFVVGREVCGDFFDN